jgi:aminopeptidase
VQADQPVLVRSTSLAAPLLLELQRAILAAGAWPVLRVELPGQTRGFYEHAQDWQLDEAPPLALAEAKACKAVLGIQAPEDAHALAGIDPERLTRARRARRPVQEQTLKKRWCSTLWPTPALAAQAGLALEEYAGFVAGALFLDRPAGPVAAWRELGAFQAELTRRLERASTVRIEADGTDVRLDVTGRSWVNSDGRRNMPSGEVFTGPVETSANGTCASRCPSSPAGSRCGASSSSSRAARSSPRARRRSRSTSSARWPPTPARAGWASSGSARTTASTARRHDPARREDRRDRPSRAGPLLPRDGRHNASALHWDLICDLRGGGRITVDGEVLQEDGRFL